MYKIAALAAVAIIIIIVFTETQSNMISTNIIEKKISETNVLASRTGIRINDAVAILEVASKLPQITKPTSTTMIKEYIHGVPAAQETEKRFVAKLIMQYYPNFETVSFLLPNGDVYYIEPFSSQKNITLNNFAFRDYYKKVTSMDMPYLSQAIRSNATGHIVSAIAVPVHDTNNSNDNITGILVGALDLRDINKILHDQIPSSELVVYLDQSGQRIVSSDEKKYSSLLYGNTPSSVPVFRNTTAFTNAVSGKSGYTVENINSMKMFIAFSPLQILTTHWVILSIEPYDKLFLPSNYVRIEGFALSAVIGGAAVLVIILLRRSFKSLNKLTSRLHSSMQDLISKENQLEKAKLSLEAKNKELDDLNQQLQSREKAQRDFINVAAHELRTPIVPILNLSELLLSKFKKRNEGGMKAKLEEGNKKIEEMVTVIVRNAYRLFHLTEDILDVTKIETQDLKLRMEELNLGQLLSSTVGDFRNNNLGHKNVKIQFKQDHAADSITVPMDKGRIIQVVLNLLSNALKFTPEGQIQVTLKYYKSAEIEGNGMVLVSVEDSGLGIDPEIYPKLFTKFATKSEEGTGLGLYISKKIIESHGGKIWAENNHDARGSTFYFNLPVKHKDERGDSVV